jgi:drug/metabolite transporter (DMT)-like permease
MAASAPIENRPLTPLAALATVALNVAFGANPVAIKLALPGFGPFGMASIRFAAGAAVIGVVALATGHRLVVSRRQAGQLFVISAFFTAQIGLFYFGIAKSLASRATLLASLQPFLVLLLAHFFLPGDRITPRRLVGIALGITGVSVVLLGGAALSADVRLGDLILLGAIALWSGTTIYSKRIIGGFDTFAFAMYPIAFSAPLLAAAAWLWDPPAIGYCGPAVMGGLLYQVFVTASLGFVAWNVLFKRHGAVGLQSFLFLQPLAGVLLGGLVLGEEVATGPFLVALPLVAAGIALVNLEAFRSGDRGAG